MGGSLIARISRITLASFPRLTPFFVFALLQCTLTLPDRIATLETQAGCEEWSFTTALKVAKEADRAMAKPSLECALSHFRKEWLHTAVHASLACKLAYLLADLEDDGDRRRLLAAEGVRWAEIAESLGAEDPETAYCHAVTLGLAVQDNPVLALKNLTRLRDLLTRAARLDPSIDEGGPLRVLGMLYLRAPPWPQGIGDQDRALGLLRYVAKHYPDHPLNHLFLAMALWEVEGNDAKERILASLASFERCLKTRDFGQSATRWSKEAKDLLSEVRGEGD